MPRTNEKRRAAFVGQEIKPCPFCGDDDAWLFFEDINDDVHRGWKVECYACSASTAAYGSDQEAQAAWNRRPE